jgi:HK97 family phage portal protein
VWVYACAERRATAAASIPLILYRGGVEVPWDDPDDPVLRILRQPMPDTTWTAWIEEISLYLSLTGTCYLEKYRARALGMSAIHQGLGLPAELWPFGAGSFKAKVDTKIRRQVIEYYEPRLGDKTQVPTSEIIRIHRPRPSKRGEGFSPVEGAEREVSTDRAASEWQAQSLRNRGVPDGVISFDYPLSPDQETLVAAKMEEEWIGARNAHRPMVLSGAKWLDLAKTHFELELTSGRQATRKGVCAAMGTPEVLFDISGSTFANLETALLAFMTQTVLPDMGRIVDALNLGLCAEFGPDVYLAIDYAAVPALLPILRAKWEVADKMLNRGVPMSQVSSALDLGVTEYRGWDVGLVPSSNVPVSAIADGYSDADLGLTGGGGA